MVYATSQKWLLAIDQTKSSSLMVARIAKHGKARATNLSIGRKIVLFLKRE